MDKDMKVLPLAQLPRLMQRLEGKERSEDRPVDLRIDEIQACKDHDAHT